MTQLTRLFNKHPKEAGMNYGRHFLFALNLAGHAFGAGLASIIHAFFPFLFTTTTSRTVFKLYEILKIRMPADSTESRLKRTSPDTSVKELKSKTGS